MRAVDCIRLELPLEARVRLLRDEYVHFESDAATLHEKLDCLVPLHGRERVASGRRWWTQVGGTRWSSGCCSITTTRPTCGRSVATSRDRRRRGRSSLESDDPAAFREAARALARPESATSSPRRSARPSRPSAGLAGGFWKSAFRILTLWRAFSPSAYVTSSAAAACCARTRGPRTRAARRCRFTDLGRHDLRDQVAGVLDFGSDEGRQLVGRRAA